MLYDQQHKLCFYRDKEKSKPSKENPHGFDYCSFDNRLIAPGDACKAGDHIDQVVEVYCKACGVKLCQYKEVAVKDMTKIVDFRYTQDLMAYRQRPDGVIGLECICGRNDTRLSKDEKSKNPDMFPEWVVSTDKAEATPGDKKSKISYNKVSEVLTKENKDLPKAKKDEITAKIDSAKEALAEKPKVIK